MEFPTSLREFTLVFYMCHHLPFSKDPSAFFLEPRNFINSSFSFFAQLSMIIKLIVPIMYMALILDFIYLPSVLLKLEKYLDHDLPLKSTDNETAAVS